MIRSIRQKLRSTVDESFSRPVLVALYSDLHINSTVALSPLTVQRDDGDTWHASSVQKWLNACWFDYWHKIGKIAKENGAEVWSVCAGDLVEGDHHGTFQLVTKNPAVQKRMAIEILEPVIGVSRYMFFVRGTPTHTGKQAWMEDEIASDLASNGNLGNCEIVKDDNRWTWHTAKFEAGGVFFSVSHHRRQNHLPWTRGGMVNRLAAETTYEYANMGWRIPNWVIRGHGHKFDESSGCHKVKVVFMPAWKTACEFVHKIAPDAIADVGGVWVLCQKGEYKWDKIMYRRAETAPWTP